MRRIISILINVLSMVNSESATEGDINQLQSALQESANYMSKYAKNEDVTICIGEPRAGKSTLVNYLIGTKLKAVNYNKYDPNLIEKEDEKSLGPNIGHGTLSTTTIPTRWESKVYKDLILWDVAGFADNRGPIQDITNAFYIYQLIRFVKSVKIILVVDVLDILQDNPVKFTSVLRALENLFGMGLRNYYSSMAVIFSKGEKTVLNSIPLDTKFITEKLKYQYLSDSGLAMSKITKGFIEYLTKHTNQIGLFMRADAIGEVTSNIDVNISQAISNCKSIQNKELLNLRPSISENSKIYLNEFREKLSLTTSFDKLQKDIRNILKNIASEKNYYFRRRELRRLQAQLSIWKDNGLLNDCNLQLIIIRNSYAEIRRIIGTTNLLNTENLIEFLNELLGYGTSLHLCNHNEK
ncbi:uncharacterized protein LOC122509160 [Leptopilina heterotoma]|uniref:uncharacterized protein LOC122509160 n=1 Tax=Leptopilina heterotoma TaxID=63436 RepID=UPI001CAA0463|nr:uncharacterized protein LOC122509160 [Leptopilina heterotoma]